MSQTCYKSKSWVIKSQFFFNVRQHGQQQVYLQYKVSWIFYKMIDAPAFSQPYLCIQLPLQSPQKIWSSTLVNFHLPISLLFVHKIIFTAPNSTLFLHTSSIPYLLIFGYSHPNNLDQKHFPYLNHLPNSGCLKGTLGSLVRNDTVLISLFFIKVWQW